MRDEGGLGDDGFTTTALIIINKEFYKYKPLRSLEDIKKDILALENDTKGLLDKVLE